MPHKADMKFATKGYPCLHAKTMGIVRTWSAPILTIAFIPQPKKEEMP
jgi:hypothetical protein